MWLMTSTTGAGRWKELGAALIRQRINLDPRFHNRGAFCEATGLKYRLVYDIEEHRRTNFGNATLTAIEVAYELEPGAIQRFLDGGELVPPAAAISAVPPPPPEPFTLERAGESFLVSREFAARMAPHVVEVEGRLSKWAGAVVQQRGASALGEIPDGDTLFGDRPQDARTWDALIRQGYLGERFTLWQLVQAIAIERVHEEDRRQGRRDRGDAAAGLIHR